VKKKIDEIERREQKFSSKNLIEIRKPVLWVSFG